MVSQPETSPTWLLPFRNILQLEEDHGFDNGAVWGGLDKFLQRWSPEMASHLKEPGSAEQLFHPDYASMSTEERREWTSAWRILLTLDTEDKGSDASSGASPAAREQAASAPRPSAKSAGPHQSSPGQTPEAPPEGLTVDDPIDRLRGVDIKLSAKFKRLDVTTVRDLLYLFPRRHLEYANIVKISQLVPGLECTVIGTVWEARQVSKGFKGKRKDTEAVLSDETGNLKVLWFGQGYLARTLKPGTRLAISGKVDVFAGQLMFEGPDYDLLDSAPAPINTGRMVPVYPLTEGLTGRNLRRLAAQALEQWLGGIDELLPKDIISRGRLMPLQEAIQQAHYPDDTAAWEGARNRLAFDELFTLQLAGLSRGRQLRQGVVGVPIVVEDRVLEGFFASLPFTLTAAQRRCVSDIMEDLARGSPPMNRLLQGEVGSGKTVVALAALLATAAAGHQGAIMVPTGVLAEQHFQTVFRLLSGLDRPAEEEHLFSVYLEWLGRPISVGLLTGSTRPSGKRELTKLAAAGDLDLLIGTHALIQTGVSMPRLALAVADEQHRFGVLQRAALRNRGDQIPHVLIMSATPIPRTLSLTLYGDLDISTIDELPEGRQQVATRWLDPGRRPAAYGFIRKEVQAGRQAFVICPLVEESELIESRAATEEHRRLSREVFPDLNLGLLHGRMSSKEKDRVMRQFRDGEVDILVSTAVVEVGIDVANATVMLIEGADRFGLAQLHQFRGRVGRGQHKSYCLLLSDSPSEVAKERLSALESIHNGFQLAEADLELRGPGDFFGTRQSGMPNLRMAQLSDRELLETARREASRIMEEDPELTAPEHALLADQVARFLNLVSAETS
ncbi:MAG: ATP-dependent DNA helicase RecG [Chloroflexi bacterium]|nr:ATP-dependent DNA helicase RecG [Chloroflexota bacterium]